MIDCSVVNDDVIMMRFRLQNYAYQREDRHGIAGCLLSVLLLLPFLGNQCNPLILFVIALVYAGLIVPLLLSYISLKTAVNAVTWIASHLYIFGRKICSRVYIFSQIIWTTVQILQEVFVQSETIHHMTSQVVFFMLVEKLICPEQRFASLYSLLFYNIIIYIRRSLTVRQWSQYMQTTNVPDYLRMTTTFVALKLAKAVVMTMVLMMVTVQFKQYEPNLLYIIVTGAYFVLSEKAFDGWFASLLEWMALDTFEHLEGQWAPVLKGSVCLLVHLAMIAILSRHHLYLCAVAMYTNGWMHYKENLSKAVERLESEQACLRKYPVATRDQLKAYDNPCAVCLEKMTCARVTPCRHIFHGNCLRLCLREFKKCPMCKRNI